MDFSLVAIFILLGMVQLAAGVVLGCCLAFRRSRSGQLDRRDAGAIRRFASRMVALVSNVTDEMDEHRTQLDEVSRELREPELARGEDLGEFVLKSVGQIVRINERLQVRLSAAEDKLQEQTRQIASHLSEARTDPLTGLPNRRAFNDALDQRIAEWFRKRTTFCAIAVDVDHFKKFNDQYGHPAGDLLLRSLADVFQRTLREMDLIGRIGGEEFAALLPSTSVADGKAATERLRRAVAAETTEQDNQILRVTISLGMTVIQADDDALSLMKRADDALYAAKTAGRNCGFFHDGRHCQRIGLADQPPEPEMSQIDVDAAMATEMESLSDSLRNRLAEVTGDVDE